MRSEVSGLDLKSEKRNTLSVVIPIGFAVNQLYTLNRSLAFASPNIEVILVNDLACEDSSGLIRAITLGYPKLNIRCISGFFGSPGVARNAGLKETTKEYIYFADSDDFIHFGAIEQSLTNATHDVEVLIGNYRVEMVGFQDVIEFRITKPEYLSIGINPGIWRMIFRKSEIASAQFSSLRMAEDQVYLAQLRLFERKIMFVDQVFYTYKKGIPGSLTSQVNNLDDLPEALKMISASLNNQFSLANKFNFVMFFRVFLTSQLRANLRTKISCMLLSLRVSLTSVDALRLALMTTTALLFELIRKRFRNAN